MAALDYTAEKTFENLDFTGDAFVPGEYEQCVFTKCDFSRSNLANSKFLECEFIGCDLSLATLAKTAFRDVKFKDSKLLGLRFEECSEFGLSFSVDNSILNHASFFRVKLRKTKFSNSKLIEADLTEADLSSSILDNCDLTGAIFKHTILEKADLSTSHGYSIDPEINRIKKAKFSLPAAIGLLDKYDIDIV